MRISDWSSDVCSSDLVDILYDHQDAGVRLYQASILAGAAGIVIAGTGNGSLSPGAARGSLLARRRGLTCVRSSRVPSGEVGARDTDRSTGLLCSHNLNPQQSRILLMLALAHGLAQDAIQENLKARSEEHTSELQSLM